MAALFAARRMTVFQFPSLKAVCSCTSTLCLRAGRPYLYEDMVRKSRSALGSGMRV